MRKLNYYIVEGGHDQDPDPEQAGRVRLRKMGAHGEGVETSHLPFSQLSSPVSGGGPFEFNRPPPPGTIVLGFDAGDSVGYAFPIGIPHGVHEKGATIPGNDALPFLSKAKDMISQNMGIPADVENILGSNRTGIQKLTKELKEKTALFSQGTTYGLPGHGAIFSLAGIRNNPIEKIQTALDQATDAIDSSKLEGLGEQLNLGSLLGQVDSSSLPKSLQDAMGNISQLLPQDLTSVQPEWGSMIGGLADPSKALSSITDKLSGIGNTGQLLDAIKGFQGGDFLSSVGSDALKQLDVATPFGNIKQLIDSKGNILSDASGIQDLIKQFSGLLGGILQGGKGQKLFSDSGTPLPEMLGRMKDMTKQTDMTQFLQQLSNLNLSKLRGREVGTSNGNTQASRNFIMDFGKQTFSELDNMVVPFKTKSSTGSSAQSFAVAVNNSGVSSNVESGSSSTNYLAEADGWFPTVASLTSDNNTRIGYAGSNALTTVIEGDYIEAGGFRYRVAASDAVDHHVTTAGGVKLYVLPDENGFKSLLAFNPSADGVTDDTSIVQTAFNSLAIGEGLSFPPKTILTNGCITHITSNTKVHFNGTTLKIGDTGTSGTIVGGGSGKIGYLFKETDDLHVTGSFHALGTGTLGTTSLAGMIFDHCDRLHAIASMRFSNMAAGRFIIECDNAHFGSVIGENIRGLQTFQSPPTDNAGTTEVVIGCQYSLFGDATGFDTEKPVRYLSLDSTKRQTKDCKFGASIAKNYTSSNTGHALGIRNSQRCSYGPVITEGPYSAINIVAYSGDGVIIDENRIESVQANVTSSGASVDSIIYQYALSGATEIGTTMIGSITGKAAGEFGILVTSGTMKVNQVELSGSATRLVAVYSDGSGSVSRLKIGSISIGENSGSDPVTIGQGGRLEIDKAEFTTGPTAAVTAAIRYNTALGTGSNHSGYVINNIHYRQNGSANNYLYAFMDLTNGFEAGYIGNIDDEASVSGARFGSDSFEVKYGRYASSAAPTSGTYSVGSIVWKTNASSGNTPGWYCTTAGTPGTWSAMAVLS